ncbi:MAG TPA: hypothetical protein PLJ38_08360, partial [bacterium]|nr:hypothetical protein [bacterium]
MDRIIIPLWTLIVIVIALILERSLVNNKYLWLEYLILLIAVILPFFVKRKKVITDEEVAEKLKNIDLSKDGVIQDKILEYAGELVEDREKELLEKIKEYKEILENLDLVNSEEISKLENFISEIQNCKERLKKEEKIVKKLDHILTDSNSVLEEVRAMQSKNQQTLQELKEISEDSMSMNNIMNAIINKITEITEVVSKSSKIIADEINNTANTESNENV